jgi:hypothetical protein
VRLVKTSLLRDAGGVSGLSGDASEALRSVALGPHAHIHELLETVSSAHPSNAEPRRIRELTDTFMATTSRHLAAIDDVLLPVARKGLPDGHHLVADYVAQAREVEHALHAVKASLYGDVNARHLHNDELLTEVRQLLAVHEDRETELVDNLVSTLDDDEQARLADRLHHSEEHAPTRPHPYTPHTGMLGRLVSRVWRVVDGFWDSAENRVIPQRARPPHPRRNSLVTRYVMGAPRFEEPEPPPRD